MFHAKYDIVVGESVIGEIAGMYSVLRPHLVKYPARGVNPYEISRSLESIIGDRRYIDCDYSQM